ncbi:MAG: hypothetical protein P8Y70_10070 [Candidatus Lokiarchaeota archaeon]
MTVDESTSLIFRINFNNTTITNVCEFNIQRWEIFPTYIAIDLCILIPNKS